MQTVCILSATELSSFSSGANELRFPATRSPFPAKNEPLATNTHAWTRGVYRQLTPQIRREHVRVFCGCQCLGIRENFRVPKCHVPKGDTLQPDSMARNTHNSLLERELRRIWRSSGFRKVLPCFEPCQNFRKILTSSSSLSNAAEAMFGKNSMAGKR